MTTDTLHIRTYVQADRRAILALWLAASRQAHPFLEESDLAGDYALVRDIYLTMGDVWVAEEEGTLLGFIGLPEKGVIGGLFVDHAQQGRGIGRALLAHALKNSDENLSLEVYETNERARSFYKSCGFVETDRRPQDDRGRPYPLIRMVMGSSLAASEGTPSA